jgi:polysaccharide transporter, PST family
MSDIKKLTTNTIVLVVGRMAGLFLAFLTSILIVRNLGAESYGKYTFVLTLPSMFSWLASFGIDNILVREAAINKKEAYSVWSNAFVLRIGFAFLALLLVYYSVYLFNYTEDFTLIHLCAVEFIVLMPWRITDQILQVELQQWRSVLANFARQIVWILLIVLSTNTNTFNLKSLVNIRVLSACFEIGMLIVLTYPYLRIPINLSIRQMYRLITFSWPLALNSLALVVYHKIDRILIQKYLGEKDLGIYATADNIAGLINIIPFAFLVSIYPIMCAKTKHMEIIKSYTYRSLLIMTVCFSGILFLLSRIILVKIFGIEFEDGSSTLQILIWAYVASTYGMVISNILIINKMTHYLTIATVVGAVINIIGNIIVLPYWGINGAAWITVFSYFITASIIFAILPETRTEGIAGLKYLLPILVSGVLTVILLSLLHLNIIITVMIFILVFTVIMIKFKIIGLNDCKFIIQLFKA